MHGGDAPGFPSDAGFAAAFDSAFAEGRILPYFQPIVMVRSSTVIGFEVLARWHEPGHGLIPPDRFVPMIEPAGRLDELLDRMLRTAFADARDWPAHLFLGFNVSPSQLHNPDLPELIRAAATDVGFAPNRIHIEITESAVIDDLARAESTLQELIDMGCSIVMDDFGTGHSSLTWLRALPFGKLKIDRRFVGAMLRRTEDRKIVNAVVGLGNSLGIPVVAEGVESEAEAELLNRLGCPLAQGFLFSPPVPADAVPALLDRHRHLPENPQPGDESARAPSREHGGYQISELYRSDDTSIAFVGPDGRLLAASLPFAQLFDRSEDDIVGRPVWDVVGLDRDSVDGLRATAVLGKRFPVWEHTLSTGRTVLVVIHRVTDEVDDLVGYSALTVDITDRKATEEALRRSEQGYRIAARLNSRLFWRLDANGVITHMSDWEWATPVVEGTVGADWIKVQPRADKGRIVRAWMRALNTGTPFDEEIRLRMPSDQYRWFRSYMAPEFAPDGSILGWHGQSEMIQERKEMQEALDDLRRERQFLLDAADRITWIAPPDGGSISVSRAWFELTGIDDPSRSILEYINPSHRDRVASDWQHCLDTGEDFDADYPCDFPSGAQWVRCRATARRDAEGRILAWHGTFELQRVDRADCRPA